MRRLVVAIGFLTRLPMPAVTADAGDFAAAIRCYPLVGLIIGAGVWAAALAGATIDGWTGALAGLAAWVAITGALHLDGLADVADGLGAAHGDRTRLIAVMADPHIGSFGTVAVALQLVAKLVLIHAALPAGWAIALAPAAARIGPLVWAPWLPSMKPGLGAAVSSAVRRRDWLGWAALLAAAAAAVPALLATPLLIGGLGLWFRQRLGGISGDAHGTGIEMTETGLLVALAALS